MEIYGSIKLMIKNTRKEYACMEPTCSGDLCRGPSMEVPGWCQSVWTMDPEEELLYNLYLNATHWAYVSASADSKANCSSTNCYMSGVAIQSP